jgi:hypothetical protein
VLQQGSRAVGQKGSRAAGQQFSRAAEQRALLCTCMRVHTRGHQGMLEHCPLPNKDAAQILHLNQPLHVDVEVCKPPPV